MAAGLFARHSIGSHPLAKRLLRLSAEKEGASDFARCLHASMCSSDSDFAKHADTLDKAISRNPYNESILKTAADFHVQRQDWSALEETMRNAAERAPWLSTPHKNRALAATKLRKQHADIVRFYESAVECATASNDDQSLTWYAKYLLNNGSPRSVWRSVPRT